MQAPSSFNMDDLERMLKDAKPEAEAHAELQREEHSWGTATVDEICDMAQEIEDLMAEKLSHPILAKVLLDRIMMRMIAWHSHNSMGEMEDGNHKSALMWARLQVEAVACL